MSHARMITLLIYILLITFSDPYFNSFSELNSAGVRNILMILGRVTDQISAKCRMQE